MSVKPGCSSAWARGFSVSKRLRATVRLGGRSIPRRWRESSWSEGDATMPSCAVQWKAVGTRGLEQTFAHRYSKVD